jgi:hypothetical protein
MISGFGAVFSIPIARSTFQPMLANASQRFAACSAEQ